MASMRKISIRESKRINEYLSMFSQENTVVREEIASVIPMYHELLEMKAMSFEEFALMTIAEERCLDINDPLFSYENILPPCPSCSEAERIRRVSENLYVCGRCGKHFAANHKSISSGTKCSSVVWLKMIHCMLNFYSMERTCKSCGISANTYYAIRNRIFYGMQLLMEEVKLYGVIQCDNTFIRLSFKGTELTENDYPEDSVFYEETYVPPRPPRPRGGRNTKKEQNNNSVCIFAAIDEFGHVFVRYAGIGQPTGARLVSAVPLSKILDFVPDKDPFMYVRAKQRKETSPPGTASLLVSDKERAIHSFAEKNNLQHEAHEYRSENVQRKLSATAHHIQAVNHLHFELKNFLRNTHYVSGKYLPGYLVLFEFIKNTGATREAIQCLFKLLSKPGCGKPSSFYKESYSLPNYLEQWLAADNPLRKLSENQLMAYYLYDQRLAAIDSGSDEVISVKEICESCNLSSSSVRRNYKNLKASGYAALIAEHFNKKMSCKPRFSQEDLLAYDEFCLNRQKKIGRETFEVLVQRFNLRNKKNYHPNRYMWVFEEIEKSGVRPPIPPLERKSSTVPDRFDYLIVQYRKEYEEAMLKLQRLKPSPITHADKSSIISEMAEKYGLKPSTMYRYVHDIFKSSQNKINIFEEAQRKKRG